MISGMISLILSTGNVNAVDGEKIFKILALDRI